MDYSQEALDKMSSEAKKKLDSNEDLYEAKEEAKEETFNKFKLDGNNKSEEYDSSDLYTADEIDDEYEGLGIDEIYIGGPSETQIDLWKKTYPGGVVLAVDLGGEVFVVRSLTRLEYKKLLALQIDQLQREEIICNTCVLYPSSTNWQNFVQMRAGVPSTLASVIMENSGFNNNYGIQVL